VQQIGEDAGRLVAMASDMTFSTVVMRKEDLQVLERARQAPPRQLFRDLPGDVLAGERTRPCCER